MPRISMARRDKSPRLPIGVATIYRPCSMGADIMNAMTDKSHVGQDEKSFLQASFAPPQNAAANGRRSLLKYAGLASVIFLAGCGTIMPRGTEPPPEIGRASCRERVSI